MNPIGGHLSYIQHHFRMNLLTSKASDRWHAAILETCVIT